MRAIRLPYETNSPLTVDADAVLPFAVAFQCLQTISGRHFQAAQFCGGMQLKQLATRDPFDNA
jgi:hypothetical protein